MPPRRHSVNRHLGSTRIDALGAVHYTFENEGLQGADSRRLHLGDRAIRPFLFFFDPGLVLHGLLASSVLLFEQPRATATWSASPDPRPRGQRDVERAIGKSGRGPWDVIVAATAPLAPSVVLLRVPAAWAGYSFSVERSATQVATSCVTL